MFARLLHRSINLIRSGHVKVIAPLKIFPASEIVQAFRYFSSSKRMGKVAISFEKNKTIPVSQIPICLSLNAKLFRLCLSSIKLNSILKSPIFSSGALVG